MEKSRVLRCPAASYFAQKRKDLVRPDRARPEARDPKKLWLDKNENPDPALAAVVREVGADQIRVGERGAGGGDGAH